MRILLALVFAGIFYFWQFPLPEQAHMVMTITAFIGFLWLTEALPLHVTALMVPMLLVLIGGTSTKDAFSPFFASTIGRPD